MLKKSPPIITAISISPSSGPGGTVFSAKVTASGYPPLTYQYRWKLDGAELAGATGSNYVASSAGLLSVSVTVSNRQGEVTREGAPVQVTPPLGSPIVRQATISPNSGVVGDTFTVVTEGSGVPVPELTYQWLMDGIELGGANGPSYTSTAAGNLSVRVIATNSEGSDSLESASVAVSSVSAAPVISGTSITPASGLVGDVFTATAWVTGNPVPALSYQWTLNGVAIGAATAETHKAETEGMLAVEVTASNSQGSASATATGALVQPALPPAQPSDPTAIVWGTVGYDAENPNYLNLRSSSWQTVGQPTVTPFSSDANFPNAVSIETPNASWHGINEIIDITDKDPRMMSALVRPGSSGRVRTLIRMVLTDASSYEWAARGAFGSLVADAGDPVADLTETDLGDGSKRISWKFIPTGTISAGSPARMHVRVGPDAVSGNVHVLAAGVAKSRAAETTVPAEPTTALVADSWIYVDPVNGSDVNGRAGSISAAKAAPMKTPQAAANKAIAGTAVILKDGTYKAVSSTTRVLNLGADHQGTQAKPIIFVAENRRQVLFDGPTSESCIYVGPPVRWVEIHGIRVKGNYSGSSDHNAIKIIGDGNPNANEIHAVLADLSFEGQARSAVKSGTAGYINVYGCEASGVWGESCMVYTTNHGLEVAYCNLNGRLTLKGGTQGGKVHHNKIASSREAMLDGELGASRANRPIPTNPPFPWAEACQSEWYHNSIKTTGTDREPGWSRGTKACNYHDNFFEASGGSSLRFLSANAAYYQNATYASVPEADRPYIHPITDATFDYSSWCRSITVQNNAYKEGMISGSLKDVNQGSLLTERGWFPAANFETAFPGVTIGPAAWDNRMIYFKVGLLR